MPSRLRAPALGRALAARARAAYLLVVGLAVGLVVVAAGSCEERSAGAPAPAPHPEPQSTDGWRYGKELAAASEGVAHSPVLELSMGDRGRAQVVAVVQRPGSPLPPVTLEVWTFEQRGEDLAPVGRAQKLHELAATGPAADESEPLAALRLARAAPGTVVHRPLGVEAADASALLSRLVERATAALAPGETERARVDAAADLLRGIDDSLAFGGRLPALVVALAAVSPADVEVEPLSERRVRLTAGTQVFEAWKAGSGWVLARWE